MTLRTPTGRRDGYVLIAVLLVIVILSLVAYRFTESMTAEYRASTRIADVNQARANAVSGVYYVAGMIADPDTFSNQLGGNPYDNEALFRDIPTKANSENPRQEGRFAIIGVVPDGQGGYTTKYGVTDETGKININGLIAQDPTGQLLFDALMKLPDMTEEIAAAIVDWVDADDTPFNGIGAESETYGSMPSPYRAKNGPLNSIDELLLVRGVDAGKLYGNDRNRNGVADDNPAGQDGVKRGWADFITVYGRYLNVDSTGVKRLNLKASDDLPTLYKNLQSTVGNEMAAYIMAYKLWGATTLQTTTAAAPTPGTTGTAAKTGTTGTAMATPAATAATGSTAGKGSTGSGAAASGGSKTGTGQSSGSTGNSSQTDRAATTDELVAAVEAALALAPSNKKQPSSVLAFVNTQVTLPKPPQQPGQPAPPTLTYASPLNDPAQLAQVLPALLDKLSTTGDVELPPRININTAPREVLAAIPGLTDDDVNMILDTRAGQSPTDPATTTGAWLVTAGGFPASKFQQVEKYVTGRTSVYRVHVLGYFGQGGPQARVEAVIDTNQGAPRILYFRDLGDLDSPRGFEPPRK